LQLSESATPRRVGAGIGIVAARCEVGTRSNYRPHELRDRVLFATPGWHAVARQAAPYFCFKDQYQMMTIRKVAVSGLVALVFLAGAGVVTAEESQPSGTVSIETRAVAIGVGVSWGDGVLSFHGEEHKFKVRGLSVLDVGVASASAAGEVYHLENAADFAGTFMAAEAGAAVGGGAGSQVMKNQNGVVMKLTSTKAGAQLKLAAEGIKVEMD
jgi:hypothetical protein